MHENKTAAFTEIFESWVKRYTNSMYAWALYKTSDKASAEDLVQDTFLTAYEQLEKFRGDGNPKTWLLAILNNKIAGHYRKKYREPVQKSEERELSGNSVFSSMFDEDDRWKTNEKPLSWHAEEKHLLDDKDFNLVLTLCMDKLPEHWRSAVYLKFIEQKKGELICQELNVAPTNFWQILHRAKLQLRKCLDNNWFKL
jgi:RNA polymerase sigma-70 factor (ECF subfamily)